MIGINAAANLLAFHLIDEELGIPKNDRFDWATSGDKIVNDTNLPDNIISELYPMTPHPSLPNPLNISAYEGTYTHPAYPDLRVSSSCSERETTIQGLQRKLPDLCVSIYLISDLFHVSGMFWVQIAMRWGVTNAMRVEFRIDSKGMVSWLGIEIEPLMGVHEEKIWWKHL
ncbi:Beta-lactamase-like protein [Penicillium freii]|nr:Beta-lactamase-like protein [Penicillium freii]